MDIKKVSSRQLILSSVFSLVDSETIFKRKPDTKVGIEKNDRPFMDDVEVSHFALSFQKGMVTKSVIFHDTGCTKYYKMKLLESTKELLDFSELSKKHLYSLFQHKNFAYLTICCIPNIL